jgi:hypothetical protein
MNPLSRLRRFIYPLVRGHTPPKTSAHIADGAAVNMRMPDGAGIQKYSP